MLSSKELLALTGISRATLNNYIQLGILPKPQVRRGEASDGAPPRLGYFPANAADLIARVGELKRQGLTMAEIVAKLSSQPNSVPPAARPSVSPLPSLPSAIRPLTFESFEHPAYLVNKRFEVEWCNDAAADLLNCRTGLPFDIRERRLFDMMLSAPMLMGAEAGEELLRFHLSIAKNKLSISEVTGAASGADEQGVLAKLYEGVPSATIGPMLHTEINLAAPGESERWHGIYASFFREGILFVYAPSSTRDADSLLSWLARRDVVIRDILKRRRPYLTPVAVLVADLQDSEKICAELPAEEYFQLINQIWRAMEPNQRLFQATHGKHAGDGIVLYFFPQPDSNYVMNALRCAQQMRRTMRDISCEWRRRKNWLNELRLNIGIDEGEEWFGTYQTTTQLEFTVLGDTVDKAARLSTLTSAGRLWVAKNVLGKLPASEREKVRFGIRRQAANGQEVVVPSTYARISNLVELAERGSELREMAMAPVTEVFDVAEG